MTLTLTQLARKTLEIYFEKRNFNPDLATRRKFSEKKACFVTLTENGNLRGCIGSLYPRKELWKEVQQNAINSAVSDQRFFPMKKEELNKIKIEVSVLSKPKKLEYKNTDDLLRKINSKMGIILQMKGYSATFLPQVWEQIPDKTKFLEHLSEKAGLDKDSWKNPETEIWHYTANVEEEK